MFNSARLRRTDAMRELVRETRLHKSDLVMPLFFTEEKKTVPVASMPGVAKMPLGVLLREAEHLQKLGIKAILLFGATTRKSDDAVASYDDESLFHRAIRALKKAVDIALITDVCMCAYATHGHCGIVKGRKDTKSHVKINNEETLDVLAKIAVSHARAGADIVAPSAMADGQVGAIRDALDGAGLSDTAIMSYSTKFASGLYGPFRDIYGSKPAFGDRRGYQIDPCNAREAIREAVIDEDEGADIVMVKPAIAYLDIIRDVCTAVSVPVAAYNVSGEYAMVKAAAARGWLDERSAATEMLNSIKRAGADMIITYWAKEASGWIGSQG